MAKSGKTARGARRSSPNARPIRQQQEDGQSEKLKLIRVELHESPPPDMQEFPPIFVDLLVDRQNCRVGKWLVFGWRGYPGKRDVECYPFVVDWNGKIDFGSALYSDAERYGSTDLLEKPISEGVLVKFDFGSEGTTDYRIRKLHELKHAAS